MKKSTIIMASIALIATISFTSCSKCQVCTKKNEPEVRVCDKDYNSNTEYGFTLDAYEAMGFKCKPSL